MSEDKCILCLSDINEVVSNHTNLVQYVIL